MDSKDCLKHVSALPLRDGDLLIRSDDREGVFPAALVASLRAWLDTCGYRDVGVLVTKGKIAFGHVPAAPLRHLGWEQHP
jgi:hypothetical protein